MKQIIFLGLCILLSINVFSQTTDTSITFKVQLVEDEGDIIDGPTIIKREKIGQDATFQGGTIADFRNWVMTQIQYPEPALKNNEQGMVVMKFIINLQGNVEAIEVLKSSGFELLDKEAIRLISISPQWVPAKNGGVFVKQQLILPITFKIN